MTDTPLEILSLGGGVQSSTLLLMSCRGELPKLDAAIFSDTCWESDETYAHIEWLTAEAERAGIPVLCVTGGNLRDRTVEGWARGTKGDGKRFASLPLFTRAADGSVGMLKRQCTKEYKILPVQRAIRGLLGQRPGQRWPTDVAVNLWFGISRDEMRRVRVPDKAWKAHVYPLIGLEKRYARVARAMTREDCRQWMDTTYGRIAPRSACLGCPFRSNAEWRGIRASRHWTDVVEVDATIRHRGGIRGDLFLHSSCVPLAEADLNDAAMPLFGRECFGQCWT